MNAVYEFVVHFESFKNIDLFRQGIYGVRVSLRSEQELPSTPSSAHHNDIKLALPYHVLVSPSVSSHQRSFDPNSRLSLGSAIVDEDFSFLSRTFRVQYCEQEIAMNDGCLFRLEVEADKRAPVYVVVELLFYEYTSNDAAIAKPPPTRADFEVVSSKRFRMADVYSQGTHAFYPVTFDDQHFCLVNMMVHGLLTDFKYRPKVVHRIVTTTADVADLSSNTSVNESNGAESSSANANEHSGVSNAQHVVEPQTFSESIFNQHRVDGGTGAIRPLLPSELGEIANQNHRYYVDSLIVAYNRLANQFVEYMREAISPHLHQSMATAIHRLQPSVNGNGVSGAKTTDEMNGVEVDHQRFGISPVLVTPEIGVTPVDTATAAAEPSEDTNDTSANEPRLATFPFPRLHPLSHRLTSTKTLTERHIADTILTDISFFAQQNFALWSVFYQVLPRCCYPLARMMKKKWLVITRDYFGSFIFREILPIQDRWKLADDELEMTHDHIANVVRRSSCTGTITTLPLEDCDLISSAEESIVMFDQTYTTNPDEYRSKRRSASSVANTSEPPTPTETTSAPTRGEMSPSAQRSKTEAPTMNDDEEEVSVYDPKSGLTALQHFEKVAARAQAKRQERKAKEPPSVPVVTPPSPAVDVEGADGEKTAMNVVTPASTSSDDTASLWDVLREHNTSKRGSVGEMYPGRHLWVFVHGYQGNSWDMRIFKNILTVYYPDHLYMLSKANEIDSEGDITLMGEKLAAELDAFVADNCRSSLGRISFVCHSLGGVILRSALTHHLMKPYLDRLYTVLSLATPHCGYLYSNNTIVDAGIWALKKWNKSVCLSQLSLTDSDTGDLYDSYMYRLSEQKGLEYFRNVLLVASMQDKYAPFHSARIELHRDALEDKKRGPVYNAMVNSLLAPLDNVTLKRIHVSFVHKRKNLDTFIGRSAHIYFLDQALYMNMLISIYHDYIK